MSVTPRQEEILLALRDYSILSSDHIKKLFFGEKAISSAQTLLKKLYTDSYVQRKAIPRENHLEGKGFYVYGLLTKGRNFLAEQGRDLDPRFRPSDFDELTNYTLHHTLEINAFLINLQLLTRRRQNVRVHAFRHEHALRRSPLRVELPLGAANVVPDAWVDLRIKGLDGIYQLSFLVEVDRGTRERRSFQQKIERLIALIPGPYEQFFDAPPEAVTVAFIATQGEKHAKQLLSWIEHELNRLQVPHLAPLFSVTPMQSETDQPDDLFLSPRTRRPFSLTPSPLIDLEAERE